eukprot:Hpha_TRINITY_DN22748_c0_g1::TRINITY_DN22748_c0_g1_i1::g.34262::m.34262/K10401/KIF18_19; kinesin family member 18/19
MFDDCNASSEIDTKVVVAVRVRCLREAEAATCAARFPHRLPRCVECRGDSVLMQDPDAPQHPGITARQFHFDHVFDETVDNAEVYAVTVRPLLQGILSGFNATCFAYGMTGAGKTYTMMGDKNVRGLCCQAVDDLFHRLRSVERSVTVRASFLEIYNERIKDLLADGGDTRSLDINEDPVRGVVVNNLSSYLVTDVGDLQTLMAFGCERRTKASTCSNVVSSRSHAILLLNVEQAPLNAFSEGTCAKFALIDLAGSERAGPGHSRQEMRMREGANINRSLLALGNCITTLSTAAAHGRGRPHVPYRDSKLTRLLKDSLGGNTCTVMIGNVSPSSTCYEETLSTLKYASRARHISRRVTRNTSALDTTAQPHQHPLVAALSRQVAELRTQVKVHHCEEKGISRSSAVAFSCSRTPSTSGGTSAGSSRRSGTGGTSGSTETLGVVADITAVASGIRALAATLASPQTSIGCSSSPPTSEEPFQLPPSPP